MLEGLIQESHMTSSSTDVLEGLGRTLDTGCVFGWMSTMGTLLLKKFGPVVTAFSRRAAIVVGNVEVVQLRTSVPD